MSAGAAYGDVEQKIGVIHREIAESSPVAKLVIEQVPRNPRWQTPAKIDVQAKTYNTSDHEINFRHCGVYFDVADIKTRKRPPETQIGCREHFFSDCHTWRMPLPDDNGFGQKPGFTIKPGQSRVSADGLVDSEYQLNPGVYSVIAYFCADKQPEEPEYFKSNTITITIAADTK